MNFGRKITNISLIRDVIELKSVTLGGYEGILVYLLPIWPKQFPELFFWIKIVLMEIEICYLLVNQSYKWANLGKRRGKKWRFRPKLICFWHLHKKVPVLINHNICKNHMLWFLTTGTFLWRWKCSTIQSCIFPEVTSYKTPTLVWIRF